MFTILSYPGNSGNLFFPLFSTILEILEVEVFNILYNPGNIGYWICSIFPYPGNIGN